jgi:hypothetical protein
MTYTTQAQVRAAFWDMLREFQPEMARDYRRGKRQNEYPADIRVRWVDFVDQETRDGHVSEALARRVTL